MSHGLLDISRFIVPSLARALIPYHPRKALEIIAMANQRPSFIKVEDWAKVKKHRDALSDIKELAPGRRWKLLSGDGNAFDTGRSLSVLSCSRLTDSFSSRTSFSRSLRICSLHRAH